ncbi:DUF192 domain-containing protein [Aquamicrobium sp. LC103]|uniref:DUF192 domain-containing protein n=1 Tax=Aquamicrobium sp. LC103 TaxID=1120658 RepID=UPI0009E3797C|nr:DUF192 domain-containing protein [Aquamicrobium sp. LC103]TKT76987.1 DUF192 domain-containing protein [Aquamicrobium sp. LC103]
MPRNVWIAALFLLFAFSAAPALAQEGWPQPGQPMILPVDPAPLTVATASGEARFSIEIADDDPKRSAGLMFREEMDEDHGMLFVFGETRPVSFWMKNTPLPLDLVFIGEDGRVRAVLPGEPQSIASISPGVPVRFVLELNAGRAQKAGISEGDRIRHPRIDQIADSG